MSMFDDAIAAITDSQLAAFGEPVTYIPTNGPPRQIVAEVTRDLMSADLPIDPIETAPILVDVANDGTLGILSTELIIRTDRISVSEFFSGPARSRPIIRVIGADGGMVRLAVQRG